MSTRAIIESVVGGILLAAVVALFGAWNAEQRWQAQRLRYYLYRGER